MSIKSDNWIIEQCSTKSFTMQMINPDGTPIGKEQAVPLYTLDKFPEMKERVMLLESGQTVKIPEQSVQFTATARKPIITPFHAESVRTLMIDGIEKKIPSFGLSSFGYDIRLARNFKILTASRINLTDCHADLSSLAKAKSMDLLTVSSSEFIELLQDLDDKHVLDMLSLTEEDFTKLYDRDSILVPPGGFVLAVSEEHIALPRNVSAICMAKSTWARSAITAEVTPLEAGWEGFITIEITNKTDNYVRIHSGIGCMQLMFFEGEQPKTSYAERGGKYMNQPQEPVVPVM